MDLDKKRKKKEAYKLWRSKNIDKERLRINEYYKNNKVKI